MMDDRNTAENGTPMAVSGGKARRGRRGRKAFLWLIFIIVGLPALTLASLLLIAVTFRDAPAAFVPDGFDVYLSTPSASTFVAEVLHLKALDTALATPSTMGLRATVRDLRVNPFLRSKGFRRLANLRVDAAYYADGSFIAVADLGWRSALTRLAPLFGQYLARKLVPEGKLTWNPEASPPRFEYGSGTSTFYITIRKNLAIASSSPELLERAAGGTASSPGAVKLLAGRGAGSLRVLVNPRGVLSGIIDDDGAAGGISLLRSLDFPELCVADIVITDDDISLALRVKAVSADAGLSSLLAKRSRTPSILSRIPESAEYFSLLAAGSPEFLWSNFSGQLGGKVVSAKESADKAAMLAFGRNIDDILFTWMGEELGVFGGSFGPSPVFFAKISNEKERRAAFDDVLGSLLVGRDVSAVVDGVRIPRVIFPQFLDAFLESLGIRLVEPFYLVEEGFLYASSSAETLAACVDQIREGKLLSRTGRWESIAGEISADSSAILYYDLDRSVPFFLRSNGGVSNALRLYKRGAVSLSFRNGEMLLELSAVRVDSTGISELAGFPIAGKERIGADPISAKAANGSPMAYWPGKGSIEAIDLSSGERYSLELDDAGYAAVSLSEGRIDSVWAVSMRGTVYCTDGKLVPKDGFPMVTGRNVTAAPAVYGSSLAVPVTDDPCLMFVTPQGDKTFSNPMHAKLKAYPVAAGGLVAALPRSFESMLYLFGQDGMSREGWPTAIGGIASAAPVLVAGAEPMSALVGSVTEAGEFALYRADGSLEPGFPVALAGVFSTAPVWVPGYACFLLASEDGILWKVGKDGAILGSAPVQHINGKNIRLTVRDINGDGREEIFMGNDGNALMALRQDFSPLDGFPVAGSGAPTFIDTDGDGMPELVCRGADDSLHAYKLGSR